MFRESEETRQWAVKEFGIKPEEFLWYHSGICYDRIGVTTIEAADKVRDKVKGRTANGGMFDGMSLGGRSKYKSDDGQEYFDVYC